MTYTEQLRIDDARPCTSDASDADGMKDVCSWNESGKETNSDSDFGKKSDEDSDYGPEESRAEKEAVLETQPKGIQWNREGGGKLRGGYGKGSRARTEREKKFANELKKEVSKIYNIMALWQRNRDLGIISEAKTQSWVAKDSESGPTPEINPLYPLSQVPSGSNPPH